MTVKASKDKRIALLATGNEITQGEIVNTNAQYAARTLVNMNMVVGEHMVIEDNIDHLVRGLRYLMQDHAAIISFGGLGPTSDDCTRSMVATLMQQPLCFDEPCWQRIQKRFQRRNLPLPDNNKQQAYFPKGATIIDNARGSADGFYVLHDHTIIFALPGPPFECIPMFKEVMAVLKRQRFNTDKTLKRWRLTGVSESVIAEAVEHIAHQYSLTMGYRASYPYLDVKVLLGPHDKDQRAQAAIEKVVKPYLLGHQAVLQSTELMRYVLAKQCPLFLSDRATKGQLQACLLTPKTHALIHFLDQHDSQAEHGYVIEGLSAYWQGHDTVKTSVSVRAMHDHTTSITQSVFIRGDDLSPAVEILCMLLLQQIRQTP